jgi:hypothetical protein
MAAERLKAAIGLDSNRLGDEAYRQDLKWLLFLVGLDPNQLSNKAYRDHLLGELHKVRRLKEGE